MSAFVAGKINTFTKMEGNIIQDGTTCSSDRYIG